MAEVTAADARIVLVEDDENDAGLALRALEKDGSFGQVLHARDGVEVLDLLADPAKVRALRLVLLDLKLPKLDGIEVLRRIRADPGLRRLPVVILTSSALPSDVAACYDAGANSFVVKQVEFERHARALRAVAEYWLRWNITPER